jgi:trk system potassium uptake protein TrkH
MNLELRVVTRQLGLLILVLSALVAAVALFAAYDLLSGRSPDTEDLHALWVTALVGLVGGGALFISGRRMKEVFGQREALLLVAVSWLVGAALAALPFRLWAALRPDASAAPHNFDSYVDCYFEAMSGLTTTGATVVQAIGTLPRSLLLWRALTHWLGGLGIVVLFVAVLPMLGVGSRRVFRIEAPGPSPEGVKPRIQDAARVLWLIYLGLTVAEIVALGLCGMDWFNAVCHTFATLATGGFSTHDASIAAYPRGAVQLVLIVFMVLAGVNFGLYHRLIQRQWNVVRRDPELRVYLMILLVGTVIVTVSLLRHPARLASSTGEPATLAGAVHHALFQVVSIQTTTGFCSADSDHWGFVAKATLLTLMFVGASAGSTGGGIKVVRIVVAAKVLLAELEHVYRPRVIRPVKIGKSVIEPEMKLATLVYVVGIMLLFVIGTVLLMLLEAGGGVDITTAATASAATLNNIGPGFAGVGATQNYAWFTDASKIVMSVLMLLGRLEMFTIVVLFSPRFWKTE